MGQPPVPFPLLALPRDILANYLLNERCMDTCMRRVMRMVCHRLRALVPFVVEDCLNSLAAGHGHLNLVQRTTHDVNAYAAAAKTGQLQVLQWLTEHQLPVPDTGMPWQFFVGLHGHLPVLEWIHSSCRLHLAKSACEGAAQGGHVQVLHWLWERKCPWDDKTCSAAAWAGHLHVLQWARAHECPWSSDTCTRAAEAGRLHVLQWLRDNGCPWNESLKTSAAVGGHLDVLQWAYENNAPEPVNIAHSAAMAGRLNVLQWLLAAAVAPVEKRKVCSHAALNGHLEVLEWAVESLTGQWDPDDCFWRATFGTIEDHSKERNLFRWLWPLCTKQHWLNELRDRKELVEFLLRLP